MTEAIITAHHYRDAHHSILRPHATAEEQVFTSVSSHSPGKVVLGDNMN